jgi:hypothetical protein
MARPGLGQERRVQPSNATGAPVVPSLKKIPPPDEWRGQSHTSCEACRQIPRGRGVRAAAGSAWRVFRALATGSCRVLPRPVGEVLVDARVAESFRSISDPILFSVLIVAGRLRLRLLGHHLSETTLGALIKKPRASRRGAESARPGWGARNRRVYNEVGA